MKRIRSKIAIAVAVCSSILSWACYAEGPTVRNCAWCHGTSAQGYAPAPRLAGQQYQYLKNQLVDFRDHARDNPFSKQYMWGAAANLGPQTVHDLALYFSTLRPRAANDGDRETVAFGRTIYQEGMPDSNIVACVVCHGPNAEGVRQIPRLAGLDYSYLKRRLEQWGEGYHAAAGPPMPHIAAILSPDKIGALASYLSFIK